MASTTLDRQYVRPLLRPDWRAWSDVIASAARVDLHATPRYQSRPLRTWKWRETYYTRKNKRATRAAEMTLSSYMSASLPGDRVSLDIAVTDPCLAVLEEHRLLVEQDTLNLEAVSWDTGETLIAYHHSRIIGEAWIAVIDTATIPAGLITVECDS